MRASIYRASPLCADTILKLSISRIRHRTETGGHSLSLSVLADQILEEFHVSLDHDISPTPLLLEVEAIQSPFTVCGPYLHGKPMVAVGYKLMHLLRMGSEMGPVGVFRIRPFIGWLLDPECTNVLQQKAILLVQSQYVVSKNL